MAATRTIFAGVAVVAVVTSVIFGIIMLGSPAEERILRLDNRRVDDLEKIMQATNLYWTRHQSLPASLEELAKEPGITINTHDPRTAKTYEYRVLGENKYELCAQFERDSVIGTNGSSTNFWSHGAERQCFQLEAREVKNNRENYNP